MWMNETQQATACHYILRSLQLGHLWDPVRGPTAAACNYKHRHPGWSSGEVLLWQFAWDMWNGSGKFDLDHALYTLDGPRWRTLATFLLAWGQGGRAVQAWIEQEQLAERERHPLKSV